MKKRILSILLTLCMVLMLVPATAFAETPSDLYSLTLNFKYGTLYGETGSYDLGSDYKAGDSYLITEVLDDITGYEPYEIVTVRSDTGDGKTGTFTDHDIVLEVVYQVQGSLAITVDGFEVGKTPKDCTYTFESTIPGVTFDEKDITYLDWKILFDGQWMPINETEAFKAGTGYHFGISLKNNGLELAPATTANGIAPMYSRVVSNNGVPYAINMEFELGTPPEPAPAITIHGPDVVCAEQDYEFSVTPAKGVTLDKGFGFDTGGKGRGVDLTIDENGVGHGVMLTEWYDLNTNYFDLNVYGYKADQQFAATKRVQVSQDHVYVDGVCGCGAVLQYTITYDGGEGVEGSIPAGVKTHGVDFTLSSETFTWDGFVQTGWIDKEGAIYDLGGVYTLDEDMTFSPYWEKLVTLTVPYTTTVALGDVGVPGEKTFTLALIGDSAPDKDKSNVTVSGSVTTNGKGSYNGTLTFTGPEGTLWVMLSEGAFVQQVDDGEAGWTVDDTVWGVLMEEIPVAYAMGDDATASGYTVYVVPASIDGNGYYYIDWENLQAADMAFTNTYTAHDYALKHDATHHWDECACKDVQNKELHKYGDWKVTKEATQTAVGEKEHTCTICGYTETAEIAKLPATTDPTKPDTETKSDTTIPQTGDNSNMALWSALLFVSGAGVIGTTVYGRKKRAK